MFKIDYADQNIEGIFSNIKKIFTEEVQYEINNCLEEMKNIGECSKAQLARQPNINGGTIWEVYHYSFRLTYSCDAKAKKIKIWNFHILTEYQHDEWLNYLNNNPMDNEDLKALYVTQLDKPLKLIQGVKAVASGENTPLAIGIALGNTGLKRSIERHGLYFGRIATELNLVKTIKQGRSHVYELTELGRRLAFSGNSDIEKRVLVAVMMDYEPIRVILGEIYEGNPFSLELIQNLIEKRLCPTDYKKKTSFRRAQALRTWTIWLCTTMGIPIRYEGAEGKQLYIPFLYAESHL